MLKLLFPVAVFVHGSGASAKGGVDGAFKVERPKSEQNIHGILGQDMGF